ncbi:hypothetical protein [uncultured Psychroserpens sp.]|uniref:hypothetical protein n=1 Tax=uncultured Psychroserpens sp. TaxID=255436 RepID=UPI00262E299F|nr:hypothetical protein [uncultured Psychroserpens sp.]
MKTFKITLSIITLSILLVGCSSVKVTDSWKDVRTSNIENKNILIVTESNNQVIRTTFEKDIVEQLSKKGYKSLESFKMFPFLNSNDTLTDEQLRDIKKELSNSGINIVVKTVLKDINEYSKTYTEGGTVYYQNTYPTYYFDGYHRRLYRSYRTIYLNVEPETTTTYTSKEYILETSIYDLTQPEHQQLSSVITSVVDNPKDIEKTSKDFSKKLVKELIQ